MNKQTALQWFVYKITVDHDKHFKDFYKAEIEQALQMEREQIVDAFGIGCQVEATRLIGYHYIANQYYNETYGGQDEKML